RRSFSRSSPWQYISQRSFEVPRKLLSQNLRSLVVPRRSQQDQEAVHGCDLRRRPRDERLCYIPAERCEIPALLHDLPRENSGRRQCYLDHFLEQVLLRTEVAVDEHRG